jgi:hypothetical protein
LQQSFAQYIVGAQAAILLDPFSLFLEETSKLPRPATMHRRDIDAASFETFPGILVDEKMARFTIKKGGGRVDPASPTSAPVRLPQGDSRFRFITPPNQSADIGRSLQALIVKTDTNARSAPKRPVFLYQQGGEISAETARSGILNAVTGALRDAIGQLTSKAIEAAYVVALDHTAEFRDRFVLYDRVSNQPFNVRVAFDAWVRNSTETIKKLVKASHENGGLDACVRQQITQLLTTLDRGASANSLLDIVLDENAMVVQRLRETLQAAGIEVDKVAIVPLMPFEGHREILENRGPLQIRVRGSESRAEIGYKVELVRDSAQRNRLYLNQLPMHGSSNAISSFIQHQIVGFLDSRYERDDFKRLLPQIESDVSGELNGVCPQRFGLRTNNLEIFNRSPEIEDQLFDFQHQYRIIGTTRMLAIEHRGVIRCVDSGRAANVNPNDFKNEVIEWIKLETGQFLQAQTLADVVELFCANEEAEENKIRAHLDQRVNARARGYGFNVSPIIAVSQNIPERELVTGREFTVPFQEYTLNLRNSRTELEIYASLRLVDASKLRRYLRDEVSLDEIVAARISQYLARELQTVAPDDFYKSDVANFGGEANLRERWTANLSKEFVELFGLTVDGLRFGRGRDPIRDRYSQLLNATETIRFERYLIGADGEPRRLGFVVQYHVVSTSKEHWIKFQSKALSTQNEREQLDEISIRIQAMYDSRIQYQPKFDVWQQAVFARHLREQMRRELEDTITREYGVVIDVPTDGIFTIDVDPARDPILKRLHEARTELELEKIKLIRNNPGASDDWGGIQEELTRIDGRVALLDAEIERAHRKLTDQQLRLMTVEEERQHRLGGATVAGLPPPSPATGPAAANDDPTQRSDG